MPVVLLLLAFAAPDGAVLFASKCASCHRHGSETRAPMPAVMSEMTRAAILKSLESGSMKEQGAFLNAAERLAIASYLTDKASESAGTANGCSALMPKLSKLAGWQGWSASLGNTRYVSTTLDATKLKLKWAFGFPGSASAYGQPSIADGVVFVGSEKGLVYALDARSGCEYWRYPAGATVRTAILVVDGLAIFGDVSATVHALEAVSGKAIWKIKVDDHPMARVTGSPSLHEGRVYVPVSSIEEMPGGNPKYQCCTFRGSVVALEAKTGKQIWKTYAIPEEPKPTVKNAAGTQMMGPAGAAIWLSPTIDAKRGVLYLGTGNGYSGPESPYSDAIIAMDLATGAMKWHQQMTSKDHWNFSCLAKDGHNCPKESGPDHDFGASPLLVRGSDGKDRVIVGQKSGIVYALDPDELGKILWQHRAGKGGLLGGIEFGMAANARAVYVPLSDLDSKAPMEGGELVALQITTGEGLWVKRDVDPACKTLRACSAALMAPATVAGLVVFTASMDGHVRAYSTADGKLLWDFATTKTFETVNGVSARGGSINGSGPVVAGNMLFVQSGYGALGGMPGNVLLAFAVE